MSTLPNSANQQDTNYLLSEVECFGRHSLPIVRTRIPLKMLRLVEFRPDGCWEWLGSKRYSQYKAVKYFYGTNNGRYAHIRVYESVFGPVPDGLELDHTCHNKLCVNPHHLEAVTHQENCARRRKSGPYPTIGSKRERAGYYRGRY